jgi:hypothetical protein
VVPHDYGGGSGEQMLGDLLGRRNDSPSPPDTPRGIQGSVAGIGVHSQHGRPRHEPLGHADPGVAGGRPAPVLGTQREDRRYQREDALSQNLRTLVRDGLVKRTVTPTVPPQVSYGHTPLGADLTVQLWGLVSWIGNHTNDILEAQVRHDAATIHP